ncbi:hypothetical protein HDU67_001160 [Dinochytrium kinnereticum]|nr:hypothetical protein HDU67_001160 [Dinochytrium kinnereticum]
MSVEGIQRLKPEDTKFGFAALVHLNSMTTADVIIQLQDGSVYPTHRSYLQRLPRFEVHNHFQERSENVIKLQLPVPHHFRPFLEYIYRGDGIVDRNLLSPDWFLGTLLNAKYLDMTDIVNMCISHFPYVCSEVIRKEEFHHTHFPLAILKELVRGPEKVSKPSEESKLPKSDASQEPSLSHPRLPSVLYSPHKSITIHDPSAKEIPDRRLTAFETLDTILTWTRDARRTPSTDSNASQQLTPDTLYAARNLVREFVTPRLSDRTLNFTAWADLVGRHGFEDEAASNFAVASPSYSGKEPRNKAAGNAMAVDGDTSMVSTPQSQNHKVVDLTAEDGTSDKDDGASSVTLMDTTMDESDDSRKSVSLPLPPKTTERPSKNYNMGIIKGDIVEDDSNLMSTFHPLSTSHPFSIIVPQSLMIYACAVMCAISKREGERRSLDEVARLKSKRKCQRCNMMVTVAEVESRATTCLKIERAEIASTQQHTSSQSRPQDLPGLIAPLQITRNQSDGPLSPRGATSISALEISESIRSRTLLTSPHLSRNPSNQARAVGNVGMARSPSRSAVAVARAAGGDMTGRVAVQTLRLVRSHHVFLDEDGESPQG